MAAAVKSGSMTVAVYQGACRTAGVAANVEVAVRRVQEAADAGAKIVVFPELFLSGYDMPHSKLREFAITVKDERLQGFGALAKKHGMVICIPYCERPEEVGTHDGKQEEGAGVFYNSAAVFGPTGELIVNYRKTHLWSSFEREMFTAGDESQLRVHSVPQFDITIGVLICYDIEFPEPARALRLLGADVLLVPTALSEGPVSRVTPLCQVPCRALENQVLILYSNHITCEEGTRKFCGLSAVVGPCGDELARAGSNTEELVVVDFPGFASYADDFARNPYFRDRRPELYASLVGGTRVESPAS